MPNILKHSYNFFNGQDKMPEHMLKKLGEQNRPKGYLSGKWWAFKREFRTIAHHKPKLDLKPGNIRFEAFQRNARAPIAGPITHGRETVSLSTRKPDQLPDPLKQLGGDRAREQAEIREIRREVAEDFVDFASDPKMQELRSKVGKFLDVVKLKNSLDHKDGSRNTSKKTDTFVHAERTLLRIRADAVGALQRALVSLERDAAREGALVPFDGKYKELMGFAVDLALPDVAIALRDRPGSDAQRLLNNDSAIDIYATIEQKRSEFAERLSGIRQQVGVDPKDRAKVTGAFLHAIADSTLITDAEKKIRKTETTQIAAKTALRQIEVGSELLLAVSTGNAIMDTALTTMNTDLPEVRAVLSQLRENYYADVAAFRFVAQLGGQDKRYVGFLKKLDQIKQAHSNHPNSPPPEMTRHDLAKRLPENLRLELEQHVSIAKLAAKARDAYDVQRARMFRSLGLEQGQRAEKALNIAARGIEVIDLSTLDNDEQPAPQTERRFLDEESTIRAIKSLSRGNKEGAFQIARFAACMEELVALETQVLGYNSLYLDPDHVFSSQMIMQVTGLTDKDIEQLGYDQTQVPFTRENMVRLGETGLNNAKEAQGILKKIYSATNKTLGDRSNQVALLARLDHETRVMAEQIHSDVTTDAQLMYDFVGEGTDTNVSALERRTRAFRGINGAIQEALFGDPNLQNPFAVALKHEGGAFDDAEQRKLPLLAQKAGYEHGIKDRMAVLARATDNARVLNPDTKSGLTCAKLIMKALHLNEKLNLIDEELAALPRPRNAAQESEFEIYGRIQNETRRELDRTQRRLAGFDENAFRVASGRQRRLGRFDAPSIQHLEAFRDAAEAIVFIKETAPKQLKDLQAKIDNEKRAQIIALDRRASSAPGMFNAVYRMIHTAVIEHMSPDQRVDPPEGHLNAVYNMAGKRDEILETLTTWGMDVDAFACEIDYVLGQPIDGGILSTVKNDIRNHSFFELLNFDEEGLPSTPHWSTKLPFLLQGVMGRKPTMSEVGKDLRGAYHLMDNYWNNKRQIDNVLREDFESLFSVLRPGEKYDLAAGYQHEINTRKIPLDPTASIRMRVRASRSFQERLRVEVNQDGGYKISGLSAWQLGTRSDIEIAPSLLPDAEGVPVLEHLNPYTRIGPKAEGRLHYGRSNGYTITFPPGEAGKTAAIQLLMKATEQEKPSAHVIEMADHVAVVSGRDNQQRARAGMMGLFGVAMNAGNAVNRDESQVNTGSTDQQGIGHEHFSGINWQRVQKFEEHENVDGKTVKTELVYEHKLYTDLEIYRTYWTGIGIGTAAAMEASGVRAAMDRTFNDGDTEKPSGQWDGAAGTALTEDNWLTTHLSVKTTNKRQIDFDKVGRDGRELLRNSQLSETTALGGSKYLVGKEKKTLVAVVGRLLSDEANKAILDSRKEELLGLFKLAEHDALKGAKVVTTYRLSDEKIKLYNNLNTEAQELRNQGYTVQASALEQDAKKLLKERENYTLGSISIVQDSNQSAAKFRGAGMVFHRKRLAEVSTERLVAKVEF
ncbi:hypothetical protein [Cognatiyoonia sp. IB215182]|uniref:hypothetical protein n=1 Tax=Cognatiyoonia sp. IB215182 TaxID=3097353 RepID=UPI002A115C42|nr:hypothetical protein [Cognatiyoonia sp. IB215182]MDX8355117.1 hypothetical protein [Cognatiyoonia sp. IB215182]